MRGTPRVVLDTDVVLSALVFAQGRLAPLRHAWQQDRCRPLVSKATTEELMRVLGYPKFKLNAEDQQELLGDYLPYCTALRMPAKAPRIPECRDPLDIPFLQLCVVGKANYLVTGDQDLLSITRGLVCPIVTADAFVNLLGKT